MAIDTAACFHYIHFMFIREIKKRFKKPDGQYEYIQHRLVESVRTEHGPRQQTVLNLGTLSIDPNYHKTLANLIEQKLLNFSQEQLFDHHPEEIDALAKHFAEIIRKKRLQHASGKTQPPSPVKQRPDYETIDTNSIVTSDSRSIGVEHISLTQLDELGFFPVLEQCGFTQKEQQYAAAQIIARMTHPASERETARWLRSDSASSELLDADFSHLSDQILHRVADKILENKDTLEKALSHNTGELFSLDSKLVLYDLTNTYFESPKPASAIAKYGRSKEKRSDCPLMTLALVVDGMGFPKCSSILEGNVSEPQTLWDILEQLHIADTATPKTIVIDAGIATEENLEKLRADKRFDYVAISRKKKFDSHIFTDTPTETLQISHDKELTVCCAKEGDETFLLCKSTDRTLKDQAIHTRRKDAFEKELTALHGGLKKNKGGKKLSWVYEKIGRIKEKYPIGQHYTIEVKEQDGNASEIVWTYHPEKEKKFGEYIIRTNRTDLAGAELSGIHRTLTMIEASFEWLKSDLGLRPNFHQKDSRMKTHALISVLAYFVVAPILNKLQWGGSFTSYCGKQEDHYPWEIPYGWKGLVRTMASQCRVTTSFQCKDGSRMDVRTTVEPNHEQTAIYKRLGINARPLKRIKNKISGNVVPKNKGKKS